MAFNNANLVQSLFSNTDWGLLREQKAQLLHMLGRKDINTSGAEHLAIEGIVNLLNNFQDTAADGVGIPEETVFGNLKESGADFPE